MAQNTNSMKLKVYSMQIGTIEEGTDFVEGRGVFVLAHSAIEATIRVKMDADEYVSSCNLVCVVNQDVTVEVSGIPMNGTTGAGLAGVNPFKANAVDAAHADEETAAEVKKPTKKVIKKSRK